MTDIDNVLKDEQVVLDGKTYTIEEFTDINPDDLVNEFRLQAARYMYIASLEVLAEEKYIKAKAVTTELAAIIALEHREKGIPEEFQDTTSKMTEAFLKNLVDADVGYLKAIQVENDARAEWKRVRIFTDSTRMRGEDLISMGATLRREWEQIGISAKKELKGE